MQNSPDEAQLKQAQEAFEIFSSQFGPDDVYKSIFLEVLLEELFEKEELCKKKKSGST
jgi:hypothetical protein